MSGEKPIYLVGMMGVGKSTIGALLADLLDRAFVDTDAAIERDTGRSVSEIFEHDGEPGFRMLERAAIDRASRRTPSAVIALGGGAIVQPGMVAWLKSRGEIVYLTATPGALCDRIGDGASRPLLAGLSRDARVARLQELLEQRRPFYEQADHWIDAEADEVEVLGRILAALGQPSDEGLGAGPGDPIRGTGWSTIVDGGTCSRRGARDRE